MGLGGILQELKTEGVLGLYHDYRSGTLRDWSGNGNHGTASVGSTWTKKGAKFRADTDEITVIDSASLQVSTMSVIILGDFTSNSDEYIFNKRGGGLTHFQFYTYTSGLVFFDGTHARTLVTSISGKRCMGLSCVSGSTAIGYLNGVSIGSFSGASTIVAEIPNLEIGNWADMARCRSRIDAAVLISRDLTATEHAKVYAQLENMRWNTKEMTPGPLLPGW
jgi:hypothetical protein